MIDNLSMETTASYDFGMVGLGVMGRNLLLNIADHGFAAAGLDTNPEKIQWLYEEAGAGKKVFGTTSAPEFIASLRRPRALMLLVPAGAAVDAVINTLLPHLQEGDIVIDGGNSYFADTDRRVAFLSDKGIHYFGTGISGGEQGARLGPSIMPGGDRVAYERVRPIFEAVAAKVNGEPCVSYLGLGSAGNYVKMVHNGIEYGLMQLIAETYDLMKRGLGLSEDQLQQVYDDWNRGELQSFLIEITARIFLQQDDLTGERLVNVISDQARSKGTGKWTSQNAMDLQVPIPTIDMAVVMRDLSAIKPERVEAAGRMPLTPAQSNEKSDTLSHIKQIRNAFYVATLCTYAQGMAMLRKASLTYGYGLDLEEVARIWRGGCIIRAACLEDIRRAYRQKPDLANLLLDPNLSAVIMNKQSDLRSVIRTAMEKAIPVPALMASLAYFDAYRTARLPTNLIQAQRDYFGAHTYERTDREGTFHTQWM